MTTARWRELPLPGDSLPPDAAATAADADPESVARKILLDQLTGQARSRAELEKKLATKGVPSEVARRVLDRFEEVGLVDDAAFAQEWVRSRHESRGLARRALAVELRRKGISDDVARQALESVDADDELEAARDLAQRRASRLRGLDKMTATRRLAGHLARKGYGPHIVSAVVRDVVGELEQAE